MLIINKIKKQVDFWVDFYLPFFDIKNLEFNLTTPEIPDTDVLRMKIFSEFIFSSYFYNDQISEKSLLHCQKQAHAMAIEIKPSEDIQSSKYLALIYDEHFQGTRETKQIRKPSRLMNSNCAPIEELEKLAYEKLLGIGNNNLLEEIKRLRLDSVMKKSLPSLLEIYLFTHCLFYLSQLGKKPLKDSLNSRKIEKYSNQAQVLLGYVLIIKNYDLIAELLVCLLLLDPEQINSDLSKKAMEVLAKFMTQASTNHFATQENFLYYYHTVLVVRILLKLV